MNDIPKTTIGVDLGGTKHYFCVLDQAGKPLIEGTLPNTKEALTELASKHPGARVAIEVGTHSPWVGEHLAREGCEVYVANARKLRAVYENERKCDLLDARMLAKIARLDPELLSPVTHISQEAMADRIVLGSREFSGTILRDTILRDHNSQGQVRENSQGQILRDRFEDLVRAEEFSGTNSQGQVRGFGSRISRFQEFCPPPLPDDSAPVSPHGRRESGFTPSISDWRECKGRTSKPWGRITFADFPLPTHTPKK